MADKLKKSLPVRIRFTDGEVITGAKLNTVMSSLERSLYLLEKAIGDIDDQSYPYFASADTLSVAAARDKSDGSAIGSDRKLEQANLARLVGPASALNPVHTFGTTLADDVIVETIPNSGNSFTFKYVPSFYGDQPVFSDAAVFTTQVGMGNLNAAGEYAFENDQVITYSDMNGGTVTYYTDSASGDNSDTAFADPLNSTYNVIPDPNQSTKCTCVGPTAGVYTITLPVITHAVTDDDGTTSTLSDNDLSYNLTPKLPLVLSGLVAGDVIPEGFLCVRDETTGKVYSDAVYYYYSETELKVGGVTLDPTHGFTVITVGSNVTETLLDLKTKLWRLRRGRDQTALYPAGQFTDRTGIGTGELYVPSEVPYNHFPQYLHRDGWFSADDNTNINDQNGMRGDLVLLASSRVGTSRSHISGNSVALRFGSATIGPSMKYSNADTALLLDVPSVGFKVADSISGNSIATFRNVEVSFNRPTVVDNTLRAESGIKSGDTLVSSYIKWCVVNELAITITAGSATFSDSDWIGMNIIGITGVLENPSGDDIKRSMGEGGTGNDWKAIINTLTGVCTIEAAGYSGASKISLVIFYV